MKFFFSHYFYFFQRFHKLMMQLKKRFFLFSIVHRKTNIRNTVGFLSKQNKIKFECFFFFLQGITIASMYHLQWLLNACQKHNQHHRYIIKFIDVRTEHRQGNSCVPAVNKDEAAALRHAFIAKHNDKWLR